MNLHEHQGKELLRRWGIPVPQGTACFTVDEAVAAAEKLGFPCVVKAQIHAGGRGKAGGVKVVRDAAAARRPPRRAAAGNRRCTLSPPGRRWWWPTVVPSRSFRSAGRSAPPRPGPARGRPATG